MKKTISLLALTAFLSGIIWGGAGCASSKSSPGKKSRNSSYSKTQEGSGY
ncbi:MAG: hypothetical protein ACE5GQ_05785 [Nitrospinales bacterium]